MSAPNEYRVFDGRRLGRLKPSLFAVKPALHLGRYLTGAVPAHPVDVDHLTRAGLSFGLYGNDKYGVCGPTALANQRRLTTAWLTGTMVAPTQDDVFDLYRRSGNPGFNPTTDADDNGVDLQTMLEAALAGGIGGVKPVAFAKVDVTNLDEIRAAVAIFGSVIFGVDLETAQQGQTDQGSWSYLKSPEWGGHAVMAGAYDDPDASTTGDEIEVISWAEPIEAEHSFLTRQLDEAWVVVWAEHFGSAAFQDGVDVTALAADYKTLTGKTLQVLPQPAPTPPAPSPSPDVHAWLTTVLTDLEALVSKIKTWIAGTS